MGTHIVVYNGGQVSRQIDEKGRSVEPASWAAADAEYVADLLSDGRLIETKTDGLKAGDINPAVIMAKEDAERRNKDAEPPKDEAPPSETTDAAPAASNKKTLTSGK